MQIGNQIPDLHKKMICAFLLSSFRLDNCVPFFDYEKKQNGE